jgi:CBS domain-containing protein
MRADDIMSINVVTVSPDTHVRDVARKLLDRGVSAVPVVDDQGHILGIISEGDLMRRRESGTERHPSWWLRLVQNPSDTAADYVKTHGHHAKDVMTRNVITVTESTPANEIAEILEKNRIKRVPVMHQGKVVGIVSRANLLHGLIAQKPPKLARRTTTGLRNAVLKELRETGVHLMIDVVVSEGVVHLWGVVETEAAKNALQVAAESTEGVESVVNHIGVFPRLVSGALADV